MPFIASIRSVYGPIGRFGRIIGAKDAITGGIISSAGGYRIHTFNDVGTTNFNMSMLASAMNVEYLIIAGGGGAGTSGSGQGGGGAGGYRTGTISSSPANYPVLVGFGGYYNGANPGQYSNGGNSSFNGIVSTGGGTTGGTTVNQGSTAELLPQAGGSGGGGTWNGTTLRSGGAGTSGQGYAGGNAVTATGQRYMPFGGNFSGTYLSGTGGGGGAGAIGSNAQTFQIGTGVGGPGGAGLSSSITGSSVTRASGGGGHYMDPGTTFGNMSEPSQPAGGGGNGEYANLYGAGATTGYRTIATSGVNNTGGGGGAGYSLTNNNGGSGVVILRYIFP